MVASHDRAFLDAVCTDLIALDPAVDGTVCYGGDCSAYLPEKHESGCGSPSRHGHCGSPPGT